MPGLRLFGHRFNFSSDDLTIPSLLDIIFRLPLLVIFIIFRLKDNSTCSSSFYIGYFYPLLSVYAAITIVASLICFVSLQGTPVNNTLPRRHMPFLLYIRLILVLIDIGINIMGIITIVRVFQICEFLSHGAIITSIVISCTLTICLIIILAMSIDFVSAEKKWEMRIKFMFCCGRSNGNEKEKKELVT